MADGTLPVIEVFSRPGCHLCDLLIDEMNPIIRDRLQLCVHNIETKKDWIRKYGLHIPVVVFQGSEICRHRLDRQAIAALAHAKH